MRDIKFRVWQKSLKRFMSQYYDGGERIVISLEGKPLEWDEMKNHREMSDDFVVQQYIGIKDRNGKEIYEGDIVKCEPGWFYQFEHSGEIYFSEEHSGYFYKNNDNNINWHINNTFKCEIIGNTHEKTN
jgi:uncharacterized phage protein (TIGR01671 family)